MGLLQFEGRLERLVEGTLAKPFRSNLQPVEIGRKLTREMDLQRRVGVHGLFAPNVFTVTLTVADIERFSNFLDALSRELADAAREHASTESYSFVGPVEVHIFESTRLRTGRFAISAEFVEGHDATAKAEVVLPDGERIVVGSEPVVVGRLPECAIVLGDPNVSRRHAEFRRIGDVIAVTDLGSTNGTQVNGQTVHEQYLSSGDEVTIGATVLVFADLTATSALFGASTNYSAILRPLQWLVVGLIYVFFLRVARAVWVEVRPPRPRQSRRAQRRAVRAQEDLLAAPKPPSKAKHLFLEVLEPAEQAGSTFDLGEELTVGRSPGCGVPTTYDVYSSTLHARVFYRGGKLWVEDLNSTNGTYVNSEKISHATRLSRGDLLQVGATVFEVTK